MQRRTPLLAVVLMLSVLAAACAPAAAVAPPPAPTSVPVTGHTSAPPAAPAATQGSSAPAASGPAHIALGKNDKFASFIVDDKGMSLYLYTKDTPGTSNCYGKCATAWPPLLTSGAAVAADGLDASKLGTTTRTDGTTQVTYNGWPLYYYAKDKQPGDTVGQDVGSVWFLLTADGEAVQ
jgi:predicted lipoprotein with Yx(FWY)xxD motif